MACYDWTCELNNVSKNKPVDICNKANSKHPNIDIKKN